MTTNINKDFEKDIKKIVQKYKEHDLILIGSVPITKRTRQLFVFSRTNNQLACTLHELFKNIPEVIFPLTVLANNEKDKLTDNKETSNMGYVR